MLPYYYPQSSSYFFRRWSTLIRRHSTTYESFSHYLWTRVSEATCSSGFPARIATDSPIVRESRKGRHCEVVKPRVVRIEGLKHPDLIAYLPFYTKDNLRYWACGKATVSWSFSLRSWSARAVFHIVLEAHQRVSFFRRVCKIARSDY